MYLTPSELALASFLNDLIDSLLRSADSHDFHFILFLVELVVCLKLSLILSTQLLL